MVALLLNLITATPFLGCSLSTKTIFIDLAIYPIYKKGCFVSGAPQLRWEAIASPTFSGIYAPNNSGNLAQSLGDNSDTTQSVKTIPNKKERAHKKPIWYKTTLFTYIIFPVVAGILVILIVYLAKHLQWH